MVYKDLYFEKYILDLLNLRIIQKIYIFQVSNLDMVLKSQENKMGAWFFLVGVILAIIIGVWTNLFIPAEKIKYYSSPIYAILVVLGIVVGMKINVSVKDSQTFMITGAILVIISRFGMESVTGSLIGIGIGELVISVFSALLALFVPATIVVALKTLFSITHV